MQPRVAVSIGWTDHGVFVAGVWSCPVGSVMGSAGLEGPVTSPVTPERRPLRAIRHAGMAHDDVFLRETVGAVTAAQRRPTGG